MRYFFLVSRDTRFVRLFPLLVKFIDVDFQVGFLLLPQIAISLKDELSEINLPLALDNGAFSFIDDKKPFPFPERFEKGSETKLARKWFEEWKRGVDAFSNSRIPIFIALMDTAVHGKRAFYSKPHRLARIYMTATLHELSFSYLEQLSLTKLALPVLQGFSIDEYIYAYELYGHQYENRHGSKPNLAVGSVCIRKYSKKAVKELLELYNELPRKYHLFGLHTSFVKDLRQGSNNKFPYSSDSASFNYVARYEAVSIVQEILNNELVSEKRTKKKLSWFLKSTKSTKKRKYKTGLLESVTNTLENAVDFIEPIDSPYLFSLIVGAFTQIYRNIY